MSWIPSFFSGKKSPQQLPQTPSSIWNEDTLGVRVKSLDEEHKKLADLIAELQEAIRKKSDITKVSGIVMAISEGARLHCIHEEEILKDHGYQRLIEHQAAHQKWLADILALHSSLRSGHVSYLLAPSRLETWFTEHIIHEDRKYAPYLRARNVQWITRSPVHPHGAFTIQEYPKNHRWLHLLGIYESHFWLQGVREQRLFSDVL